jgi:hypothetical protein
MLRLFGVGNQLVDGLLGEILAGQKGLLISETKVAESIWAVESFNGPNQHFLTLRRATNHLFHFAFLGAARMLPGFLGSLFLTRGPLGRFAFFPA